MAAAGIGAVMAPALGSALISGVLVAVGGGVLAAGIVGAAKSPKVVKAWQHFGEHAAKTFERFSKPFIKPLVRAAGTFTAALKRAEPIILRIGQTMAPFVEQLAFSAALFIEKLLPGILRATTDAQPFIDILLLHLPLLAESIGRFFEEISAGSGSAQVFFEGFLTWLEGVIPKMGAVLAWLANLRTKIDEASARLAPLKDAFKAVGDFIVTGMAEARQLFRDWLEQNNTKIDRFIVQISGFIKDTGPAFRITILGIAISLQASANAIMEIINQLDRLKNWYNRNKDWLQIFTVLPISGGGAEFGKLPGRAHGGPVTAGRSYMVGERGVPELFTPRQSGYITPLEKVQAAGAAAGTTSFEVHVHVDDPTLRDLVRVEIRESNRSLKRGVLAGAGAR